MTLIQLNADLDYSQFLEDSKTYFNKNYNVKQNKSLINLADFTIIAQIGIGAFGNVYLARYSVDRALHAIKRLSKAHIVKSKQLENTKTEKMIMLLCQHPNVMKMEFYAMDKGSIYFIMPYISGGDLHTMFHRLKKFDETLTKFYAAQVFLALEFLHYLNIIYRDMKPENIILDNRGYVKLTDFGFSKVLTQGRTYTLCGTPEYISPEMIMMKPYGLSIDWWSFGILIYELTAGSVPFKDNGDHLQLYNSIVAGKFKIPPHFSKELKDIITELLQVDTTKRLGCLRRGPVDIKNHVWFADVAWMHIFRQKVRPLLLPTPKVHSEETTTELPPEPAVDNFIEEFRDF